MTSRPSLLFRGLLPWLALLPLLAGAACSVSPTSSSLPPGLAPTGTGSVDAGLDAGLNAIDIDASEADASVAPTVQNNLLCVVTTTCDPDNAETASSCHLAPDGGAYDPAGGYSDAGLACRVQPSSSVASNGLGQPTACSVAGAGRAGDSCKLATDCAAGLDCVGEGVCRHYCCAGNGQCDEHEFCDIQNLASATTTKVPVCMPIWPCSLLKAVAAPVGGGQAECPAGQTCAIVREDGATGCLETGPKKAGESCDSDHCGPGLVCLGALNARLCYALCNTAKDSTCAPQTCQGGLPLFQDPTVGVCR